MVCLWMNAFEWRKKRENSKNNNKTNKSTDSEGFWVYVIRMKNKLPSSIYGGVLCSKHTHSYTYIPDFHVNCIVIPVAHYVWCEREMFPFHAGIFYVLLYTACSLTNFQTNYNISSQNTLEGLHTSIWGPTSTKNYQYQANSYRLRSSRNKSLFDWMTI